MRKIYGILINYKGSDATMGNFGNRGWPVIVFLVIFAASAAGLKLYGRVMYRFSADVSAVMLVLSILTGLLDRRQDVLADLSPWQRWYLLILAVCAIVLIGIMRIASVEAIGVLIRFLLILLMFQMGMAAYGEKKASQFTRGMSGMAGSGIYVLFLIIVLGFLYKSYRDLDMIQYLEPLTQARQIPFLQAEAGASVFGAMMFWMAQQIMFLQKTQKAGSDGQVQLWRTVYLFGMIAQPILATLVFLEAAMRETTVGWAVFIALDLCFCFWMDQKAGPRSQRI